jgi:hypothetical protein
MKLVISGQGIEDIVLEVDSIEGAAEDVKVTEIVYSGSGAIEAKLHTDEGKTLTYDFIDGIWE